MLGIGGSGPTKRTPANKFIEFIKLTLNELVDGIKKKDFTSEEVTSSFIQNSQKAKKLNKNLKTTKKYDEYLKTNNKNIKTKKH